MDRPSVRAGWTGGHPSARVRRATPSHRWISLPYRTMNGMVEVGGAAGGRRARAPAAAAGLDVHQQRRPVRDHPAAGPDRPGAARVARLRRRRGQPFFLAYGLMHRLGHRFQPGRPGAVMRITLVGAAVTAPAVVAPNLLLLGITRVVPACFAGISHHAGLRRDVWPAATRQRPISDILTASATGIALATVVSGLVADLVGLRASGSPPRSRPRSPWRCAGCPSPTAHPSSATRCVGTRRAALALGPAGPGDRVDRGRRGPRRAHLPRPGGAGARPVRGRRRPVAAASGGPWPARGSSRRSSRGCREPDGPSAGCASSSVGGARGRGVGRDGGHGRVHGRRVLAFLHTTLQPGRPRWCPPSGDRGALFATALFLGSAIGTAAVAPSAEAGTYTRFRLGRGRRRPGRSHRVVGPPPLGRHPLTRGRPEIPGGRHGAARPLHT